MKSSIKILLVISALVIGASAQQPSLQETFDWISNTLQPSEGNNWYIHHPFEQPYPQRWVTEQINPYHKEIITDFSHDGCRVRFVVEVIDNDSPFLFGKQLAVTSTDTFDLKDIDPTTIKVTNSCEPMETDNGQMEPYNCKDVAGLQMEFKTRNSQPAIHREEVGSGYKSEHGRWQDEHHDKNSLDALCKDMPGSKAYCDYYGVKEPPKDVASSELVFHSPAYTKRFIEAFRHAVELCGGKASTF
jgi:hypothetical protein